MCTALTLELRLPGLVPDGEAAEAVEAAAAAAKAADAEAAETSEAADAAAALVPAPAAAATLETGVRDIVIDLTCRFGFR